MSHTQKEDRHVNDFIDPIFSCREQVKGNDASLKYVIYIEMVYISHLKLQDLKNVI